MIRLNYNKQKEKEVIGCIGFDLRILRICLKS